jgi:NOL1/NOP2/fmu family ribosome biogenesis protein
MRKSGVRIGSIVRGELNPDHELTMSLLASKQIQTHDLDYEEALRFLRKEKINLFSHQRGWIIITYLGIPLGWIKAMEGRSNNYYPKNWRITLRS